MNYGISKTTFNTSVAKIRKLPDDLEIILTERITRKKASSLWPLDAIKRIDYVRETNSSIVQNRDVELVNDYETRLDKLQPFFMFLEKNKLIDFTSKNEKIKSISHHYAHALAAMGMSPFEKCLILVRDGAGNKISDLKKLTLCLNEDSFLNNDESLNEMVSLYKLENGALTCLDKEFQKFSHHAGLSISDGIGILYEACAEYIFNSKRAAGKVMGLAPLGECSTDISRESLLSLFKESERFLGKSKKEWEQSSYLENYKNIAATMQALFERESFSYIKKIKDNYGDFDNIILTGGTALNCTFNMKLVDSKLFKNVYVPPFPGDECISFGCALYDYYQKNSFQIYPLVKQHGYFGSLENVPDSNVILELFKDYNITHHNDISLEAAKILSDGHVVAWYQGRSESGPRALGNRSILSRLNKNGVKDYLNKKIKFREDFRPYGGSFIDKYASEYFDIEDNFLSPYMSFALNTKINTRNLIAEVVHVDNSSRAQIFSRDQNAKFYDLILEVGKLTGVYGVLNTSLNIMGEPIVESLADLLNFFINSEVEFIVVDNFIIGK